MDNILKKETKLCEIWDSDVLLWPVNTRVPVFTRRNSRWATFHPISIQNGPRFKPAPTTNMHSHTLSSLVPANICSHLTYSSFQNNNNKKVTFQIQDHFMKKL